MATRVPILAWYPTVQTFRLQYRNCFFLLQAKKKLGRLSTRLFRFDQSGVKFSAYACHLYGPHSWSSLCEPIKHSFLINIKYENNVKSLYYSVFMTAAKILRMY